MAEAPTFSTAALAVETVALEKRYGNVEALRGISFSVERGEVFALLGPNGAGKTTLVQILTTLLQPSHGTARVLGMDVAKAAQKIRRSIGVTFQDSVLDPRLSGREILFYHGRLQRLSPQQCQQRIKALEQLMELGPALDRRVKTYSGGMKRRLELARALLPQPPVLFLDEPTIGLDPQNRAAMWQHIQRLSKDEGCTVLFTTHYMEEAEALADRVAIIDEGRILIQGEPADLVRQLEGDVLRLSGSGNAAALAHTLNERGVCRWAEVQDGHVLVGAANSGTALAGVVQASLDVGYDIADLTVRRPSLGELFLKLTGRSIRD